MLDHSFEPVGLLQGCGANDDTGDTDLFQHEADRLVIPQSAAEFAGNLKGFHDPANGVDVDRPSRLGSIEVNQMQDVAAVSFPAFGHGNGVISEDCLLSVVPLSKPHAAASPQIDRWQNLKH